MKRKLSGLLSINMSNLAKVAAASMFEPYAVSQFPSVMFDPQKVLCCTASGKGKLR
jgi:hypothetical protein